MSNVNENVMTVSEAAKILGIRKCEAICLADAGDLVYVCDGKNGKCRTVTSQSVVRMMRTNDVMSRVVELREAQNEVEEVLVEPVKAKDVTNNVDRDTNALLIALINEVKQLKGIICAMRKPMQMDLGLEGGK